MEERNHIKLNRKIFPKLSGRDTGRTPPRKSKAVDDISQRSYGVSPILVIFGGTEGETNNGWGKKTKHQKHGPKLEAERRVPHCKKC